jgi:hypothetical protein
MKARERSGVELRTLIIVFIVIIALAYYFLRCSFTPRHKAIVLLT